MARNANVESSNASQQQPRVERSGPGAEREVRAPYRPHEIRSSGDDARRDVRVPAQVLGGAVPHQVGSEGDRELVDGRRDSVVDDDEGAAGVRELAAASKVRNSE